MPGVLSIYIQRGLMDSKGYPVAGEEQGGLQRRDWSSTGFNILQLHDVTSIN